MTSIRETLRNVAAKYQTTTFEALGLWRIALGALGTYDVIRLWRVAPLFFSDEGVYPRVVLPDSAGAWGPFNFVAGGWLMHGIFAACLAGVLSFLLGLRFSRPLLALSLLVLHNRIPQLRTGGEAVFQLQAAFAMFLPVNRAFSIRFAGKWWSATDHSRPANQLLASWVYPLVLLQLAVNYLFNFVNKLTPTWLEGTALSRALGIPSLTTELGGQVVQLPSWFLSWATYGTLIIEFSLALLIVSPWRRRLCHRVAAILMLGLHGGIALTMEVGIFSAAMLCHVPLLLLSPDLSPRQNVVWDSGWRREVDRYAAILLAILLFGRLAAEEFGEPVIKRTPRGLLTLTEFSGLQQGWGMFMLPPDRDYAVVTRATTRSGEIFDPWRRYASNNSEPLSQLHPGVMKSHLFARFENGILDWRGPLYEPFGAWILKQSAPDAQDDPVAFAEGWFINVPSEPQYRVMPNEIPELAGLAPLELGKGLPVKIASTFGTWMPQRAIDGLSVPEGSHAMNPIGTSFNVGCSQLTLELEHPAHLRTVYLQSDAIDEFVVEVSRDGQKFALAGVTERIRARQYRSRILEVDFPDARFIRLRPSHPRPLRHFVAEVAFYSQPRKLPELREIKEQHFVAAYDQPAVLGLLMVPSPEAQECSWPADVIPSPSETH